MLPNIIATLVSVSFLTVGGPMVPPQVFETTLASHEISLNNRYPVQSVSDIFRDNILLNLSYLNGDVKGAKDVNWDEIKKTKTIQFKLNPGETFAYHDLVLPEYKQSLPGESGKGRIAKTTNAHFNYAEGFKSDGYLVGDGVCHLASLMYWVAKDAGLQIANKVPHDFMAIPEIEKANGVSIHSGSATQNLYITNNKEYPVEFKFEYDGTNLKLSIVELN
ncbi:MAG: VanW family protein [Candidatus Daviesbacteria bacterium]|nr:VanW family protein [Candidatus Daviesbacteria bacterium]